MSKKAAPKNKAVIYVRVSSDRQVDNMSLGEQERVCREFCQRNELTVVRLFREEGESAKTADRTQLQKLLEYCRLNRNEIGHLVVYKVDRFTRKVEDHAALRAILKKMEIILSSASEPINETTTGVLMEHMLAAFAQFDNDVRSERSRGGMAARAKEGCWVSQAPTGYINVKDELKRPTLAFNPDQLGHLREFFAEFLTGKYSQTEAIQLAKDTGVLSAKRTPLTKMGVIKLLRNVAHTGYIQNTLTEGKLIKGIHPAYITQNDHYRILAILDGRKVKHTPKSLRRDSYPLRAY